ncbi:hypothetical protein M430DRAFT_56797 [Amorphotheca resinae ATCC 22711]|uniref:Uncharacterized protein n=1 Tax=Amorphotheca resinae ATCC 22711 TaxID=857342 RepID=A0A2T3B7W9_AMORE|nr:hypothetical protein M430DRAFT_56797 [Amorphotheca resinae ATCC 22711]PSS22931.1 hypothetical protein M430DRAFT_56797 [Amorphotheca resinae ATCC 22711]
MAPELSTKSAQDPKEGLDVISNRIAMALAKHDSLVKSWTALSARPKEPEKTQEELDAEEAALFRSEPPYLGVGAPIPSHFLISDAERNNKSLRAKFFPTKGLKASKSRDEEEKATSAKRRLMEESSDEEEGRSSLGKAKKRKMATEAPAKQAEDEDESSAKDEDAEGSQADQKTSDDLPTGSKHQSPSTKKDHSRSRSKKRDKKRNKAKH